MTDTRPSPYELAAVRYMCMRHRGELAHLSQRDYLANLEGIGITWHGPPPKPGDDEQA